MTDDTTPEVTEALNEAEAALDAGFDVDSPELDAALQKLKERLGVKTKDAEDAVVPQQSAGSEVDWSDYDLDPKLAHLYPSSRLHPTENGARWVVDITEFMAVKNRYELIGKQITQMINGPEGWRLQSAVVPVNALYGIATLQRVFPIILPTPMLLKAVEDIERSVEPLTEEETVAMEKQALAWAAGEGTPPAPPSTPSVATNPTNAITDIIDQKQYEHEAAMAEFAAAPRVMPGAEAAAQEALSAEGDKA